VTRSLSTPNVLVRPQIREEIANPANYSSAGDVLATQDGAQIRLDFAQATRAVLAADRTYFVRSDGDDGNDGLANDAGGAFLTIQAALAAVATIDFGGHVVTIDIQAGTWVPGQLFPPATTGQAVPGDLLITSTAGAILVADIDFSGLFLADAGARFRLGTLTLQGSGSWAVAIQSLPGSVTELAGTIFSSGFWVPLLADGGYINMAGDIEIAGSVSGAFMLLESGGYFRAVGGTVTMTGTPAIGNFCSCSIGSQARFDNVAFSGASTGQRFAADSNGVIKTNSGADPNYLPGDAPGTTSTGGLYL
jgi:hypothetical protein